MIVLCTEAKGKARMEELASEGRASAEGVNRPFHFRVKLLFCAKKEVKGADAMDGERFFELFGDARKPRSAASCLHPAGGRGHIRRWQRLEAFLQSASLFPTICLLFLYPRMSTKDVCPRNTRHLPDNKLLT